MRIVSKAALHAFWREYPAARESLLRWYDVTVNASWRTPAEVKATLAKVDPVIVGSGRTVMVVNIGGNKYRLIMAVHYDKQRVFVLRILTHKEYDKNEWKKEL